MRKILWLLTLLFVFSCGCGTSNLAQNESVIEHIDAKKFKELLETGNGIILDVRTPEEIAEGHLAGASIINFYDEDFKGKINLIQKDKPVYIYCRSSARSSKAAEILKENGFQKVYNLKGGITAWQEMGYPIVKPEGGADNKIQQLSLADFQKMLDTDKPVLVDFHTKWCVPCRKMAPIVDKLAEQYKDKAFVIRVDIDKSKEVARHYQIQGIPVFMVFKNKAEKWKYNGIVAEEELIKKLEENL